MALPALIALAYQTLDPKPLEQALDQCFIQDGVVIYASSVPRALSYFESWLLVQLQEKLEQQCIGWDLACDLGQSDQCKRCHCYDLLILVHAFSVFQSRNTVQRSESHRPPAQHGHCMPVYYCPYMLSDILAHLSMALKCMCQNGRS